MIDKAAALHVTNRLGFGPAPGDLAHVAESGFEAWLDRQLQPRSAAIPASLASVLKELPTFGKDCGTLYAEYWWKGQLADPKSASKEEKHELRRRERRVVREAQIARLARAVASPWQLEEALVDFWFSHFNVYGNKGPIRVWVGAYEEEAIRPHVLGRFSDLLLATAKHPAMLFYLDNAQNVAPEAVTDQSEMGAAPTPKKKGRGINENFAREVMELHTLGVDGGYVQADVTSLAHILTGWTIGPGTDANSIAAIKTYSDNRGAFRFAPRRHDPTPEKLLGRTFSGAGEDEGDAALLMLASHPATAHHISFQLAQYFVADEPDHSLVDAMTAAFRGSGGNLRSVTETMARHPQFLAPANFAAKFKTPYRYVVSAARAAGMGPSSAESLIPVLADLGQPLYGCVSPDGYACTQSAWLDPNGLLRRVSFALQLGTGAYGGRSDGNNVPLDPKPLRDMLAPVLSSTTLAALSHTPREQQAGAILGSPEFMRC